MDHGVDDITLASSAADVGDEELSAFFVGWPDPPSNARRATILRSADEVLLARDRDGTLVGFITAITDRTFAAYIPLLEVHPAWQARGIGSTLVTTMLDRLRDCYMIDLVCDDDLVPFYERLGGTRLAAVAWRRYERLDGDQAR